MKALIHQRHCQQHGYYISGRLERLESAVDIHIPIELECGVEKEILILIALEGIQGHCDE